MSPNGGIRRVTVVKILAFCFVSRTGEVESCGSRWGGKDNIEETYIGLGIFVTNIPSDYIPIKSLNSVMILIVGSWL